MKVCLFCWNNNLFLVIDQKQPNTVSCFLLHRKPWFTYMLRGNTPYEFGTQIDRGANGKIFVVFRENKLYIMKIYNTKTLSEAENEDNLQNLAHSFNLAPKIYDFWTRSQPEIGGTIIMDKVGLYNMAHLLDCLIRDGNVPLTQAMKIRRMNLIRSTIFALDMAVKLNTLAKIIHGDLHTGNVMVEENEHQIASRVWLIDFGHSATISQLRQEFDRELCEKSKSIDFYKDAVLRLSSTFRKDILVMYDKFIEVYTGYKRDKKPKFGRSILKFIIKEIYEKRVLRYLWEKRDFLEENVEQSSIFEDTGMANAIRKFYRKRISNSDDKLLEMLTENIE